MANIVILGAGLMGSAFSVPLSDNGHQVRLVGTHLDGDIIEEVQAACTRGQGAPAGDAVPIPTTG